MTTGIRQPFDRTATMFIAAVTLLAYAWFFQGDGWSHLANYSTIRSLIERQTFEITPFRHMTGDVAVIDGRTYSNKPPGLALIGAIVYAPIHMIERAAGAVSGQGNTDRYNQVFLTIALCAIPGAATAAMIYHWFRRRAMAANIAMRLALAFPFGSIVWPFSGTLFNHVFVMALLLGAWLLISSDRQTPVRVVVISLMLGVATITDYLAGPIAAIFFAYDCFRRRSWRRAIILAIGPLVAGIGLLIYHHAIFGNAFTPTYLYEEGFKREPGADAPRFDWPDWRRLYWITWHRMRGLFYCSPIFALALLAPFFARRRPDGEQIVCGLVIAFYVAFYLTYTSWLGGNGVGPRFAIPALPFIFFFVRRPAERLWAISWILIALSVVNMLAVTAVEAISTGNESGVPQHWDPIGVSMLRLIHGQVAQPEGSHNLGLLLGLRGAWSVLPITIIIVLAFAFTIRRNSRTNNRTTEANASLAASES